MLVAGLTLAEGTWHSISPVFFPAHDTELAIWQDHWGAGLILGVVEGDARRIEG